MNNTIKLYHRDGSVIYVLHMVKYKTSQHELNIITDFGTVDINLENYFKFEVFSLR